MTVNSGPLRGTVAALADSNGKKGTTTLRIGPGEAVTNLTAYSWGASSDQRIIAVPQYTAGASVCSTGRRECKLNWHRNGTFAGFALKSRRKMGGDRNELRMRF